MTQTGNGAVSMSAIEFLRSCYFLVIRNPIPIIIIDTTRMSRRVAEDCFEWTFYYNVAITERVDQLQGVLLVHVLTETDNNYELLPGMAELVETAMPSRYAGYYLLPTLQQSKHLLQEYLVYQTTRLTIHNTGKSPPLLLAHSTTDRLELLNSIGIPPESVPVCIGGYHTDDAFHHWIRMRTTIEGSMSSAPIMANRAWLTRRALPQRQYTFANGSTPRIEGTIPKRPNCLALPPSHTITNNTNGSTARFNSAVCAAAKNVQTLPEMRAALRQENARLKAERQRLKTLLAEAKRVVKSEVRKLASPPWDIGDFAQAGSVKVIVPPVELDDILRRTWPAASLPP